MKNWKLLTVLMAMMLLVLAACGSKEDTKEEDKGSTTDNKPAVTNLDHDALNQIQGNAI